MTEIKNFDGDISVGRHAVVGGDAKVCGGMTVGKNLKVEGWLDAKNLKAANKGVFLNEESLKKAYPVPKDGWWALVGNTLPAALWVAADGEWGNTGGTGGDILLESEVLADIKERLARAQEGVDAATTKNAEQDNRLANAEVLNTKQNERLLNYVYPKLYQLNEGAGAHPFDGMYSGSASVLSGRKTAAEEGYTYKVVFALGKFLLQEISSGGVTIGLYEEWDKIISGRGSSEDYTRRDCVYYVYTEGEGSYYYYVDADGNISEKSGTYVLRKLIDETKAKVSTNTEKLDVQERYVAALNAASSEHSQKIEAIEGRAGEIEAKNSDQDKEIVSLINRLYEQEEVVVALPFDGFTDTAADRLMPFNPKDTYSYHLLFSTASNSFVLRVVDNANQVTKYIGTYSSWNAVGGVQASSYYERRDTLYKYLDLSYGAYRYYYYGEDGSFFEAPGTKYLSKIIEKQGGKIDENTQKVEELQAQVSSIEKVEDIQWGGGRHMNVFIEKGDFHIHGERTDANDGLPILNAASGHTIDARLTVLDSSLTNGTGEKTDACVTQILRLSNRTGGDGHVYVRTAQAASKAELTATDNTKWGTWEKLMGIFEKNVVENAYDLDGYTTNGMYSGVFMFSGYQQNWGVAITPGSTFLLVTVNGYAVAKAGLTPQLTQTLYLLPAKDFNAPAKMYLRTAYWNASAKSWNYQNWDKIATANDLSPITAEVQSAKTLANNNAGRISDVEGRVSGAEGRIAAIENIIPEEYGLSTIVELGSFKNFALLLSEAAKLERVSNIGISLMHGSYLNEGSIYNGAIIIQQTNADSCTSIQYIFLDNRRFTRFIRYSSTDVVEVQSIQNDGVRDIELKGGVLQLIDMWSNPIGVGVSLPDSSNIYEGNPTLSTVPIVMTKSQGGTVTATLMPATSARAGVMTAADKEKLDALSIGDGGGTVDNALLTEVQEKAQSALNTAIAAKTTAQGAQTTADNANIAAQDAKATADGIAAKADSASIAAAEAKQTAGAAKSASDAAQTTANSAHTAAQEAKATATSAQTTATSAQETANNAQTAAQDAKSTASSANTAAQEAKSTAGNASTAAAAAQTTANSAKSAAETAQTAATSAQETANSASEKATAASTAAQEAKTAAETAQSTATAAQTKNSEQDARLNTAEATINSEKAKFEALKVEFEKVKNSIGVNIYGSVRVSGISDPQLTFRRYIADGAAGNPLDVIHPCLVEKGTGKLLHVLQNLNFEKDINGAPRKIDGSEGEVYITNTEPIYHITGHVYVNGVSYDVFLRSLYPFTWQGKEAEVIEPFGLSPDNCVAHKDDDGVTRMHSVYNPEWAGSYYAMNGFVGKYVYEGIGNAMTDTYDASGALFDGAGGLASVSISLTNGEQYAMNMNEDTTKTVPFFNEHAYALELFIGHMYAEGGTYDAHNAALMGSGFTANNKVTNNAHFNADNELAVNGARYLGGDGNTTRYVGNASYGQWYANGTKNYLPAMLTNWSSPWKIMERQRVMAYAIENNIPELTWFAFEGNKYKWRSVSGFAGPNDGVMTCVVFKVFSTQFAADMVDPTDGASLEGHRIDFMITGAMYRGWSTDVSPSRWDSGLIFTTDNTAIYKAYIQRDQSKMIKSAFADANADTVLPFEESYEYIGSVQGIQRNYRRDFSDGSLFHAKSTEQSKGGNLHTHIGAYNWYDSQSSAAGLRSVRGFRRGYASFADLSPCTVFASNAPSFANTGFGFGTCVRIAKET